MRYSLQVKVMPLKNLLDPQGKATADALHNLGLEGVVNVRVGKNIVLEVEAESPSAAKAVVEAAAKSLLANPVMEFFEIGEALPS